MDKNANPFLSPEWSALQQQYIDALSSLSTGRTDDPQRNNDSRYPWNDALEHWRKTVEPFLPGESRPLFDDLLSQARTYYSIAGGFAGLLQDIAGAGRDSEDWRGIMTAHFARMKAQFDDLPSGGCQDNPFFQHPLLDSWKKTVAAMSVLPGETVDAFTGDDSEIFAQLLSIPGLGPTREFQGRLADAIRLGEQFQTKFREYQSLLAQSGKLALDEVERKIIEIAGRNDRITSLKQLYDIWIDANEEVFAGFAFNDDHAKLYGELVNALMQYRLGCNRVLDDIAGIMNMPNGAAMQTVYKRQHQMRRALQDLGETQRSMQAHLHQLQVELGRLHGAKRKTAAHRRAAGKPGKTPRTSS